MKTEPFYRLISAFAVVGLLFGASACSKDETAPKDPEPNVVLEEGTCDSESITISLSATEAEEMAYLITEENETGTAEIGVEAPTVFSMGIILPASETPQEIVIPELKSSTAYVILAAARHGEFSSGVSVIKVTTPMPEKLLSAISATKNSLTYKVDAPKDMTYRHSYIAGWYYDLLLEDTQETEGSEFNMSVFLWNLLADYGYEGTGSQEYTWTAGDEDPAHGGKTRLVGGHKYYAIMSPINGETEWLETPEAVAIELEEPGASSESVTITADKIEYEQVTIRMECDPEKVYFYYYDLYPKNQYDAYFAEKGEEGMMEYLYEYGYVADNTYTDRWGAQMGGEYVLALMGVDYAGDTFYQTAEFTTPVPDPSISLTLQTYERELDGYYAYNTLRMYAVPSYFTEIDPEYVFYALMKKSFVEEYLSYAGMTLEDLKDPERFLSAYSMLSSYFSGLTEEQAATLQSDGDIEGIYQMTTTYEEIEPDTEYCYILAILNGEQFIANYATTKTEPQTATGEAEEEYKAYLGNWTVTGQSTEDWSTEKVYNLRIEQLTANRSFKVYGWSDSEVAEDFPFIMRYDTSTKKYWIEASQELGTATIEGEEMTIALVPLFKLSGDQLYVLGGYSEKVYSGKIVDDRLQFFSETFMYDGRTYSFSSISYVAIDSEGNYNRLDAHDVVNFRVNRASGSAAPATGVAARLAPCKVIDMRPELPAREVVAGNTELVTKQTIRKAPLKAIKHLGE